jgi:hypothetical protein
MTQQEPPSPASPPPLPAPLPWPTHGHLAPGQPPPVPPASMTREKLRAIAWKQKAIILCLLAYLTGVFLFIYQAAAMARPVPFLGPGFALTAIAATVFVFMLAIELYGPGVGALLGLLTLIPIVGLCVLLVVNGKATDTLKKNGISVGFLGASLGRI